MNDLFSIIIWSKSNGKSMNVLNDSKSKDIWHTLHIAYCIRFCHCCIAEVFATVTISINRIHDIFLSGKIMIHPSFTVRITRFDAEMWLLASKQAYGIVKCHSLYFCLSPSCHPVLMHLCKCQKLKAFTFQNEMVEWMVCHHSSCWMLNASLHSFAQEFQVGLCDSSLN